ncbi:MAG: hypothetical protein N2V78_06340 [Methanophagales archaeon]|nr:hypothetical protein [Methanophagales archaeon]
MPPGGSIFWFYLSYSFVILVAIIFNVVEVNGDIYGLIGYAYQRENR